jgi:tetratricopeptide (TPR) repeat protein/NAD-dependent SIR2 family protein deacetylase
MSEIPTASVKQLAYKIKGFGKYPRIAFFLGAGASRQSGIITAGEMIRYFKDRILAELCPDDVTSNEEKEKWLASQAWYQSAGGDYSKLFEQFEPKEIGRQRYIESIIEGQEPSFGYVVLANLMANNLVNTVITTNFDDLVYSACTTYTGIRPIVYAYGVLASEMRITAPRAKILKLHGDYLYSPLKNTGTELAFQDPNMKRQLTQVLNEFGLVVIGYSGEDESVMSILREISEKNDLYWRTMRGTMPNEQVQDLLRKKKGRLVEIDGFDEMMNELRQTVAFKVETMFSSLQERQDKMIDKFKLFPPAFSEGILSETAEALRKQAADAEKRISKTDGLKSFAKARKAEGEGNYVEAERLYNEALTFSPDDAVAHNNLGLLLFEKLNRGTDAEAAFKEALRLDPKLDVAWYNLATLLSSDPARRADAEEAYVKAIESNRSDKESWLGIAHLLVADSSRYADVELAYRTAIEIDPTSAIGHNNYGLFLYEKLHRNPEAEALFKKAIELDPNFATAQYNLATMLTGDPSRHTDAEAAYLTAMKLEPTSAVILGGFAYFLSTDPSRFAEAAANFRKAIELDPANVSVYDNLRGVAAKDPARYSEVEAIYRSALKSLPGSAMVHNYFGVFLSEKVGRNAEAEAVFKKAIELDPGFAIAYYNLATVLAKDSARSAEAEAAYRQAIAVDGQNASFYADLGYLLSANPARLSDAEAAYRKALEIEPSHAAVYFALGNLLSNDHSRYEDAETAYRKAIELVPNYTAAYYNLANLLAMTWARYSEAEIAYRKAIESDPGYFKAYNDLLILLRLNGRDHEALPIAEKWAELDTQNPSPLLILGSLQRKLSVTDSGQEALEKATKLIAAESAYDLARLEAIRGNNAKALEHLSIAAHQNGFNPIWARVDPDLSSLRQDPGFEATINLSALQETNAKPPRKKRGAKKVARAGG